MASEKIIKRLQTLAVNKGANSTKLIDIKDVYAEDWVREKCEFGCWLYAKRFTCPPYTPTPKETRKMLQDYEKALLVEFTNLKLVRYTGKGEDQQNIHKAMFDLERDAFLSGFYKAFAYSAGPCSFCKSCPAEKIENPTEYSQKECRNQREVRPSMEACGIDVYKTARKAGYKIDVIKQKSDTYKSFGLLLLE